MVEHRQEFDRELEAIEAKVIELFAMVAEDLPGATNALLTGDNEVLQVLAERQQFIHGLYPEIERLASREILLQAPVASDLRFLLSVLRILPDVERSHHSVVEIATRANHILGGDLSPRTRGLVERMGILASEMWRQAVDSWYKRDPSVALALGSRDEEMDELHASLIAEIASGRMTIPVTMEMTLVARFYERLGDHAVNIARRVIYLAGSAPGSAGPTSAPQGPALPMVRQSAGRPERLTEVAPGVLVATSSYALTTTTIVVGAAGSGGCLLIDPAVTAAELAGLAADLATLGLRPTAAWSTHPHWDHVLWSRELGDAPRYAAPAAARVSQAERDTIRDEASKSAPGHDLSLVGRLIPLDAAAIPWDGPAAQVIIHDGHAPGHGAVFLPGTGVLVAGDMCSDVEMPLLDLAADDPLGDYRTGLQRLAAVPGVRRVVPGHGHAGDVGQFGQRLAADSAYLDAVALGQPFADPRLTAACEPWLHVTHDEQVRFFQR